MKTYKIIVILGPTAAGKSALGVTLAKRFNGVIISADSRQVYQGMDLGTGKITKKEMSGVPHYLLDVASPRSQYSVSRYVRDVSRALNMIKPETTVFLVGGSPFYIKAVTEPGSFSNVPPDPALRRRLATLNNASLMTRLKRLNVARANTIDPANRRRLIRAIEIAMYQPPPVHRGGAGGVILPPIHILKIGLNPPRTKLYQNIDHRVDVRLRQGMIAEVARLHKNGVSWKRLDDFGLEYRFLSRYLRGQLTKAEAAQQLKYATHQFAKRQMTWWKKDQTINWIKSAAVATRLTKKHLI